PGDAHHVHEDGGMSHDEPPIPEPVATGPAVEQPVEYIEPDVAGLYFRSILLADAGTIVPQHSHDHDHATLVCSGAARLWVDGVNVGDKTAGQAFFVKAGARHLFQALEPGTRLCCVHSIESAEAIHKE
ncbi:MAG: cupin domain-containing protein, partial [Pseudomonadota bacterium]